MREEEYPKKNTKGKGYHKKSKTPQQKERSHPKKKLPKPHQEERETIPCIVSFTQKLEKAHQKKRSHKKTGKKAHQEESVKDCKATENVDEAWLQVHFLFLREHQEADDVA